MTFGRVFFYQLLTDGSTVVTVKGIATVAVVRVILIVVIAIVIEIPAVGIVVVMAIVTVAVTVIDVPKASATDPLTIPIVIVIVTENIYALFPCLNQNELMILLYYTRLAVNTKTQRPPEIHSSIKPAPPRPANCPATSFRCVPPSSPELGMPVHNATGLFHSLFKPSELAPKCRHLYL